MADVSPKPRIGKTKLVAKPKGEHFKRQESKVENFTFLVGKEVWIKIDAEEMFALATVVSFDDSTVHVVVNGNDKIVNVADCLNANHETVPSQVTDMVKLRHANTAVILDVLRQRFMCDLIYTYAGRLLVACNPFKMIPGLYSNDTIERYRKADTTLGFPSDLDPHVFALAQCAMNGLVTSAKSQTCIISGESGAGKTETARQLINYFSYGQSTAVDRVQAVILGSGAILEAFGNAKTLRNNNSSRFGKFLKILLSKSGGLEGGIISSFMLELSRIEFQSAGERNFHIFYQCIKSLDSESLQRFKFLRLEDYKFLNAHGVYDAPGIDDLAEFGATSRQLSLLFGKEDIVSFYNSLSGILLCGNVEFAQVEKDGVDTAAEVSNFDVFVTVCELLGLDVAATAKAIVTKTIKIQGNVIDSPVTVDAARVNVRAMAKDLYGALFEHCISVINQVIAFDADSNNWIGILDIYGFEYFDINTFEQLLINYANERLQEYFIKRVFQAEITQYKEEEICFSDIVYTDNAHILSVFDNPNASIFAFLQEQCLLQNGTCDRFTASCKTNIKVPNVFLPDPGSANQFSIVHTAATVKYNTEEFLKKNKHRLSDAIVGVLCRSKNALIKTCSESFLSLGTMSASAASISGGGAKANFIASKFHASISRLMTELNGTDSYFVRCVKTNQEKAANLFQTPNVYNQLISLSIVEAIETAHRGFAYNASFQEFVHDFDFLPTVQQHVGGSHGLRVPPSKYANTSESNSLASSIRESLQLVGIDEADFQIGKTRVFLKKRAWLLLECAFLTFSKNAKPVADALYSAFLVYANRARFRRIKGLVIRLQSNMRRFRVQRQTLLERRVAVDFVGLILVLLFTCAGDSRVIAAITIQAAVRARLVRRKYLATLEEIRQLQIQERAHQNLEKLVKYGRTVGVVSMIHKIHYGKLADRAATTIASVWRMHCAIRCANNLRLLKVCNFAATMIQKHLRGMLQRRRYLWYLEVLPSVEKLQALFRGCLARKHLGYSGTMGATLAKIRNCIYLRSRVVKLQASVRTCLVVSDLYYIMDAVVTIQVYAWSRAANLWFTRASWAAGVIARWWNRYKFKCLLNVEKEHLVQGAMAFEASVHSRKETLLALGFSDARMINSILDTVEEKHRGWLPIHVLVTAVDAMNVIYPNGWCRHLFEILGRHEDSAKITHLAMGSFVTYLAIDNVYLYTFGMRPDEDAIHIVNSVPQPLVQLAPALQVKHLCCGVEHAILQLSDGSCYAWGRNDYGQLGISGAVTSLRSSAKLFTGETSKFPCFNETSAVHRGHLVKVKLPTLIVFPSNRHGNAPIITSVDAGSYHNCAIDQGGQVYVWGRGSHIGLEAFSGNFNSPECHSEDIWEPSPVRSLPLDNFTRGSVHCANASTVLLKDGALYSFGTSKNGQLGRECNYYTPPSVSKISLPGHVTQVSCGANFTLAMCQDSSLYIFGTVIVNGTRLPLCNPTLVHLDPHILSSPIVEAHAGWWDLVVQTQELELLGCRVFKSTGDDNALEPLWYSFTRFNGTCASVKIVASPTISVVAIEP